MTAAASGMSALHTNDSHQQCEMRVSARSANSVLTVGTLLHLSDLHLAGAQATGDVTGDYKIDVVLPHERQRRTSAIKESLESLGSALLSSDTPLDPPTPHWTSSSLAMSPCMVAQTESSCCHRYSPN